MKVTSPRAKRTKTNFRVTGSFDMSRRQEATVTIQRAASEPLFSVRVLRRKKAFTLPLADVAKMVVWRMLQAEAAKKKKKRKTVSRGLLSLK